MFRRIVITGALLAAFTAPSLATDWYVLKATNSPETAKDVCIVVDRTATPGEEQLAGPFGSQTEGMAAAGTDATCMGKSSNSD